MHGEIILGRKMWEVILFVSFCLPIFFLNNLLDIFETYIKELF